MKSKGKVRFRNKATKSRGGAKCIPKDTQEIRLDRQLRLY